MMSRPCCAQCGVANARSFCTGCGSSIRYCSEPCQREHWKIHRKSCARLPEQLRGLRFSFLREDQILTETLLARVAIDERSNEPFTFNPREWSDELSKHIVFTHTLNEGETLREYLERIHRDSSENSQNKNVVIPCDCSFFVQLLHIAQRDICERSFSLRFSTTPLFFSLYKQAGCLTVNNDEVYKHLQQSPIREKGQWLYDRATTKNDKDKMYVGMSSDGPIQLTLDEWTVRLQISLKQFISTNRRHISFHERNTTKITSNSRAAMLNMYGKMGKMDEWCFIGWDEIFVETEKKVLITVPWNSK